MTTLREAAQQALEFIRWSQYVPCQSEAFPEPPSTAPQVEAALRAALAEPVQEPVAWYHVPYPNNGISPMVSLSKHHEPSMYGAAVPLYLSPIMEPKIKTPKEEPVAWAA